MTLNDIDYELIGAACNGNINKIKKYHRMGADIHLNEEFILGEAAYYGHLEIVKYIIENGAKINSYGYMTGLITSDARCHKEVYKYLKHIDTIYQRKEKLLKINEG